MVNRIPMALKSNNGKCESNRFFSTIDWPLIRSAFQKRQMDGALSRVPPNFFENVWSILERTPGGIRLCEIFLPQVTEQNLSDRGKIHFIQHKSSVLDLSLDSFSELSYTN